MSEELKKETVKTNGNENKTNMKLKIALAIAVAVIVIGGAVFAVSAARGGSDNSIQQPDTEISSSQQQIPEDVIGEEAALETAIKEAGVKEADVTNSYVELESDDGIARYEVEFYADNTEYSFEIDAQTGNILSYEKENAEGSYSVSGSGEADVSSDEAKKIAIKKAGVNSSDIYNMDIELEQGVYEVSFDCGGLEYDVVIDADTGDVVHYTTEYDN